MRKLIIAAVLTLAPLPAAADVQADLRAAILACLDGNGDAETTAPPLVDKGWTNESDTESGVATIYPASEDPIVSVALDGSYCNIESQTIGSEAASQILLPLIETDYPVEYDKSEDGCTQFGLGDGVKVTVLSGGNDPTCAADSNSALRFEYEPQ